MLRFRPFRAVAAAFLFSQLLISYVWFGLVIWPALAVDERPRKLRDTHERNALRLYDAFVTLKGVYVKIGQFLSTQAVLLPAPYLAQMVKMQDRNPSASEPAVRARIHQQYNAPVEEVFAAFEPEPLACASIGQVHRVTLKDGRDAVIKVKYPGIDRYFQADLAVVRTLLPFFVMVLEYVIHHERTGVDHPAIIAEFVKYISLELDYEHETENHRRMYEQLGGLRKKALVIVPELYEEHCREAVICMQYIEAHRLSERYAEPEVPGANKDLVFSSLVESLFYTIAYHGFFQADTHPGNFLVTDANPLDPDSDAVLVMLDFGCTKELPENGRTGIVDIVNGYLQGESRSVTEALWEQGLRTRMHTKDSLHLWVDKGVLFLDEIFKYFKSGNDIVAHLQNHLSYIAEEFHTLGSGHRIAAVPEHYLLLGRVVATAPVPLDKYMPQTDMIRIAMRYMGVLAAKAMQEKSSVVLRRS